MYARSNTIQGDPAAVDRLTAYCRDEVMPLVQGLEGNVGISMLADRDGGRCIVTTSWETEEAMRASDGGLRDSRREAGSMMGATPEVAEWEIALMHRAHEAHDGARTRVIRAEMDPAAMDGMISDFRAGHLPQIEALPGFCSFSMLVDRQRGRCAMAVTYEDRAAMDAAGAKAAALRQEAQDQLGMRMTDVAEYDLLLHHLRVPEMA
jgi:heme-degrading monooxygenase HmoA